MLSSPWIKMMTLPEHTEFIDIHSHNPVREENVFRIYNLNLGDFQEQAVTAPVSAGLHPWHIVHFKPLEELEPLLVRAAEQDLVIAIGETGIDKVIMTNMTLQEEVFRIHVDISEEFSKPLIIHCVRAFEDIVKIRKETGASQPWILHGFNSSPQMAEDLASKGFYLSVGERLLRNRDKTRDILRHIPLSSLFTETDDDNMPIEVVYNQLAEIAGISLKNLKDSITGNLLKVFKG